MVEDIGASRDPQRFYFFFALALAAIAFGGFSLTYFYPLAGGRFVGPAILHVHGALFFAWTLLFVAQARLASTSIRSHRALGLVGISLATAMVASAFVLIVSGLDASTHSGTAATAGPLAIVPITAISTFCVFFVLAIANRQRPEHHKRYMVMATLTLLPPAVARVLFVLFAPPGSGARPSFAAPVPDLGVALRITMAPALLIDLLILVPIVYDWRLRGRPHPIYVAGGGSLVLLHIARPFIADTTGWHGIASALTSLAR
ncbi:MAG TPA: hypothetical protein VMR50_07325 [Myxococcota bacterium]|nr:hypothetical protein [Myxococcota bacterium]